MRRPAANEPGYLHELTFSCYRGYPFLRSERTCQWLADSINRAREDSDFSLWAYVFMPEHVHILICPNQAEYDVSAILKAIKQPVGMRAVKYLCQHSPSWFPRVSVKRGSRVERRFWQAGGGFDRGTIDPRVILAMIEYIHANPVRKLLAETPKDWKWSSAGWREEKNSLKPDLVDFGGLTGCYGGCD
jgi:putative transposase